MSIKFEAVATAFPTRRVGNAEIIAMVREHSSETYDGDLEVVLTRIGKLLNISGAKERRMLAAGERPIDLICQAVQSALQQAQVVPDEIDLLIWCGVGKGFLEPGQSYMLAHALGWQRVECFDILDACMSWMRALQIGQRLIESGRYRRVMVVNGEFNGMPDGPLYPANFQLHNEQELQRIFASYTIGNAATATILSAAPENHWDWGFISRPDLADLCTLPGKNWDQYCIPKEKIAANGTLRFTSYGAELHEKGADVIVPLWHEVIKAPETIKAVFTHASSWREWHKFAGEVGMADRLHCVYPDYGNLVSASVPAALALAQQAGHISRGDRIALWVGSAGMSFACAALDW